MTDIILTNNNYSNVTANTKNNTHVKNTGSVKCVGSLAGKGTEFKPSIFEMFQLYQLNSLSEDERKERITRLYEIDMSKNYALFKFILRNNPKYTYDKNKKCLCVKGAVAPNDSSEYKELRNALISTLVFKNSFDKLKEKCFEDFVMRSRFVEYYDEQKKKYEERFGSINDWGITLTPGPILTINNVSTSGEAEAIPFMRDLGYLIFKAVDLGSEFKLPVTHNNEKQKITKLYFNKRGYEELEIEPRWEVLPWRAWRYDEKEKAIFVKAVHIANFLSFGEIGQIRAADKDNTCRLIQKIYRTEINKPQNLTRENYYDLLRKDIERTGNIFSVVLLSPDVDRTDENEAVKELDKVPYKMIKNSTNDYDLFIGNDTNCFTNISCFSNIGGITFSSNTNDNAKAVEHVERLYLKFKPLETDPIFWSGNGILYFYKKNGYRAVAGASYKDQTFSEVNLFKKSYMAEDTELAPVGRKKYKEINNYQIVLTYKTTEDAMKAFSKIMYDHRPLEEIFPQLKSAGIKDDNKVRNLHYIGHSYRPRKANKWFQEEYINGLNKNKKYMGIYFHGCLGAERYADKLQLSPYNYINLLTLVRTMNGKSNLIPFQEVLEKYVIGLKSCKVCAAEKEKKISELYMEAVLNNMKGIYPNVSWEKLQQWFCSEYYNVEEFKKHVKTRDSDSDGIPDNYDPYPAVKNHYYLDGSKIKVTSVENTAEKNKSTDIVIDIKGVKD